MDDVQGRDIQERKRKPPNLPVQPRYEERAPVDFQAPVFMYICFSICITSITVQPAYDIRAFAGAQEPPRLVALAWKIHHEYVSRQPNDAGQESLHDEYPAPAGVVS